MIIIRNLIYSTVLAFSVNAIALAEPTPLELATYQTPEFAVSDLVTAQQNFYDTTHFKNNASVYGSSLQHSNELLTEIGVYLMIIAVYLWYFLKNNSQ